MFIPILLGSPSDKEHAKKITDVLDAWPVQYKIIVVSAHKVPELVLKVVKKYNAMKEVCFITIAGRSNGLSGVTAGATHHPVIACPPFKDKHDYLINIHSTLQMPSETPVLTVIDPTNAALCALRILGIGKKTLQMRMQKHIDDVKESFKVKRLL